MNHNSLIPTAMKFEPEALAQRAGNRNLNGPRQIYMPAPIILCTNAGVAESPLTYATRVRVPTPDSRCRVKLSILFVPTSGEAPDDITGNSTLWAAACDYDQKGIAGGGGRTIPETNLVGTEAAPTAIPVSAGLLGYSREFVTAADVIEANFATQTISGVQGAWVLQTRIQPDAVTLDWVEWDEIRRLFLPLSLGAQGAV